MSVEGSAAFWWAPQDARKAEKMLALVLLSSLELCLSLVIVSTLQIVLGSCDGREGLNSLWLEKSHFQLQVKTPKPFPGYHHHIVPASIPSPLLSSCLGLEMRGGLFNILYCVNYTCEFHLRALDEIGIVWNVTWWNKIGIRILEDWLKSY